MAGHDYGHGIPVVSHTDRAKSLWSTDYACDLGVASGFAIRNCEQCLPTGALKIRATEIQRKIELAPRAREVFFQFQHVSPHGVIGQFELCDAGFHSQIAWIAPDRLLSGKTLVEFERGQAAITRGHEQRSDRGGIDRVKKQFHGQGHCRCAITIACRRKRSLIAPARKRQASWLRLTEWRLWPKVGGCKWWAVSTA